MNGRIGLKLLAGAALIALATSAPAAPDPATRSADSFLATAHLNPRSPAEFTAALVLDFLGRPLSLDSYRARLAKGE
ncbi:MAG TPA: hypothetical protein VE891_09840 [Allosphingosinicella sp.]|nr:hypothetical protein [Allosphingosinicella sp.]